MVGVDDRRSDRHQVAQPLARRFQFGRALFDVPFEFLMGLAELRLFSLARAEIRGNADHPCLLPILVEED